MSHWNLSPSMIEFTLAVHSTIIPILSSYTRMVLFPADAWIPLACTALFSIIQSAVRNFLLRNAMWSMEPDQPSSDQTRPDQTSPDQTSPASQLWFYRVFFFFCKAQSSCGLPARLHNIFLLNRLLPRWRIISISSTTTRSTRASECKEANGG